MPSLATRIESIRDQMVTGTSTNEMMTDVEAALALARRAEDTQPLMPQRSWLQNLFNR